MRSIYIFLVGAFCLLSISSLLGQCVYQGTVVDVSAYGTCEIAILTPGGIVYEMSTNPYDLEAGDQIRFNFEESASGSGCLGTLVDLNCMEKVVAGNGNPCDADFDYSVISATSNTVLLFPKFQFEGLYSYSWDFEDTNNTTAANPVYTFSEPGLQEVCLTITTPSGCESQFCKSIDTQNSQQKCGVNAQAEINNGIATGQLYNILNPGQSFESVSWKAYPEDVELGTGSNLAVSLSPDVVADQICVSYFVSMDDGSICSGEICREVQPTGICTDLTLINPDIECPEVNSPVCGCDGVTYNNACEALYGYGVSSYSQGPCPPGNGPVECLAFFEFAQTSNYTALCTDFSQGNITSFNWEVDGLQMGYAEELQLENLTEGIYEICLTVEDETTSCSSQYCRKVYIGVPANLCEYTDCVWPGDSDANGKANNYDLLELGLGIGSAGILRQGASIQWQGQFSPDWGISTTIGNDFKHLDYNGDGQLSSGDMDAVSLNYIPSLQQNQPPVAGQPKVYLEFDQDSLIIDENSPEQVAVSARIMVGSTDVPVSGMHGMAFQIMYPQQDVILPHSAEVTYSESFLGMEEQLLVLDHDLYSYKRIDAVFSRKSDAPVSGHGPVGQTNFIVVSDIIGGRSENTIPFVLQIEGLRIIDGEGNPLDYDLAVEPAVLYIINNLTTSDVSEQALDRQWMLYPNPAEDVVYLNFGTLNPNRVRVQNITGMLYRDVQLSGSKVLELDTGSLAAGVYTVEVTTDEGRSVKRLVIE
ncbi:MAG: T9SS type A sorting domain-containing protein [Bacteroidetes bacterium]|nr:T9SS type A sorting domain-containing protein [Bacteroidota bacterium]